MAFEVSAADGRLSDAKKVLRSNLRKRMRCAIWRTANRLAGAADISPYRTLIIFIHADMAELAAFELSAADGRLSDAKKVLRSNLRKRMRCAIWGTANRLAGAADISLYRTLIIFIHADMAELADAHGSGPCESNFMQVRPLLSAPKKALHKRSFFVAKQVF